MASLSTEAASHRIGETPRRAMAIPGESIFGVALVHAAFGPSRANARGIVLNAITGALLILVDAAPLVARRGIPRGS